MTTHDESARPPKKRNERTCAGCQKTAAPEDLVRVVLDPVSGELAADMAGSAFGRGAHVHGAPDCLKKALKSGFSRAFKQEVKGELDVLAAAIVEAADRRIEGLLSGAKRGGQLAIGADAVKEAKEPALFVVARDAAAAAKLSVVDRAIAAGKAIAFAEKSRLGSLLGGRDGSKDIAVIAIVAAGVGEAVERTFRLSAPFRKHGTPVDFSRGSAEGGTRDSEEAWSSSEVR